MEINTPMWLLDQDSVTVPACCEWIAAKKDMAGDQRWYIKTPKTKIDNGRIRTYEAEAIRYLILKFKSNSLTTRTRCLTQFIDESHIIITYIA